MPTGLYLPASVIDDLSRKQFPEKRAILDKNHIMLQHKLVQPQPKGWQQLLAEAIRDPNELLKLLDLPTELTQVSEAAAQQFPLCVPRGYVARMKKGDPNDPLLRQVLPLDAEMQQTQNFTLDPVGDHDAIIKQGLMQKYHGRVLIVATAACAIHCRYCFRRHFPYNEQAGKPSLWQQICDNISQDVSINEVILSGGDPLSLSNSQLLQLLTQLEQIPQLTRIRFHSRYPVVLPQRIDTDLTDWFAKTQLNSVMVVHCNHANEINHEVRTALTTLKSAGVTLLNQAVLLRGINDNAPSLCQLSEKLFDAGVIPYYLHMLDKVQGAAHFEVPEEDAKNILTEVRKVLPGYLVPKLVREIAHMPYKQPL